MRIRVIEEGNAGELRQLSINQFTKPEVKPVAPKERPPPTIGSSPPDDVWYSSDAMTCRKSTWMNRPDGKDKTVNHSEKLRPKLRQLPLVVTGRKVAIKKPRTKARRPATASGLQWFSPYK